MAADSTVTIENRKAYAGVNKLFRLSDDPPMGIMIYNNAEFLDIPVETIIKEFSKRVNNLNFSTLNDIVDEFKLFLEEIVKDSLNLVSFADLVEGCIELVNEELKFVSIEDFQNIVYEDMRDFDIDFLGENLEIIENRFKDFEYLFEDFIPDYLESDRIETLKEDIKNFFIFRFFLQPFIGIVIAGFEENNFFPSYVHFKVSYLFDELFVLNDIEQETITNDSVILRPFAQDDVINAFMKGFDNHTEERIVNYSVMFHKEYYLFLLNYINESNLSYENKNDMLNLVEEFEDSYMDLNNTFADFIKKIKLEHEESMVEYLSFLPYEELSNLAESLINITSMKRKIQDGLETVGGPVDVVIITKGDGFIWSKNNDFLKSR